MLLFALKRVIDLFKMAFIRFCSFFISFISKVAKYEERTETIE